MSEQQLQKQIIDYLENRGYITFKVITANKAGIPDIIGCSPTGRFVCIEVKAPGKLRTVSKLQQRWLLKAEARGAISLLVDDLEIIKKNLGI